MMPRKTTKAASQLACLLCASQLTAVIGFTAVLPIPFLSIGLTSPPRCQTLKMATDDNSDQDEEESLNDGSGMLDEMTRNIFKGGVPTNPFGPGGLQSSRLSKADLYDEDELISVFEAHKQLVAAQQEQSFPSNPSALEEEIGASSSLHDLVMQTIGDISDGDAGTAKELELPTTSIAEDNSWMDESTKQRISNICAIASDIDGTILAADQNMHPRTKQAIRQAVEISFSPVDNRLQWFFPATGKSRKGALDSLGVEIGSLLSQVPGVFIQGLYCVDGNGNVIYEQKLNDSATAACEKLASDNDVSVVAYDGDNLYSTKITDPVIELHELYGEPMPQLIESLTKRSMHKILLMDNDVDKLNTLVRPQLEALAQGCGATVTQALPTMLEWLPEGCSKAKGVSELCKALGVDPGTQLLALGDAENDAGMLKMAAIGVSMGNGSSMAKEASDFVLEETNNEGGAGVAMEVFGFPSSQ